MTDETPIEPRGNNGAVQNNDSGKPVVERLRLSLAQLVAIAVAAISLIAVVVYLAWPRHSRNGSRVGTSPAAASVRDSEGEHDEHSQEGSIEVTDETAQLMGLKTGKVVNGEIEDTVATIGRALVSPNGQAIVGAKVDGRATKVLAEPGQSVKAGQVVAIIDSPEVAELRGQLIESQAKLRLAEQNLSRTTKSENRAAVLQSKNKLDFAQNSLERKRRLAELGATAAREVAEAEMEYKNARAEYDYVSNILVTREQQQATSEVEQSRAVVQRLRQSLAALGANQTGEGGTISLLSPIAGTVIDRHLSIGQSVSRGAELMTVMNLSSVVIEAQLPESQATRVSAGQRMVARLPGLPDRPFDGRVESVGKAVDPAKRTVPVRARLINGDAILKHEMAVEVRISTGVRKDGLLIPASAVVDDEGLTVVYVKEGNRYERRPVKVGIINFQLTEILSGLEAGEEVVKTGAYQLKNLRKSGDEDGEHHDDH